MQESRSAHDCMRVFKFSKGDCGSGKQQESSEGAEKRPCTQQKEMRCEDLHPPKLLLQLRGLTQIGF
jgi:hypothetical protein